MAVVIAVSTPTPPQPHPGRLQIVAELRLGGQPQDAVLAGGSLWVADFTGEVVRVDPASRRVVARTRVSGDPRAITSGEGGVWVTSTNEDTDGSLLSRIDPRTGRVVERIPVDGYVTTIANGAGGVWLVDLHRPRLDRIDPSSHALTARIPFPRAAAVTAAGNTLWAHGHDGTVVAVDGDLGEDRAAVARRCVHPGTACAERARRRRGRSLGGEREHRGRAADPGGSGRPADRGGWSRPRTRRPYRWHGLGASGRSPRGAWPWYRLSRIDPDRGTITGTIELGNHLPRALVPAGSGVWVIAADGTALLVRPEAGARRRPIS